jgi:hypothetical protein
MRKLLLITLMLLASPALAQVTVLSGQNSGGTLTALKVCDQRLAFTQTFGSGVPVQLIAGVATKKIYVCGFYMAVVNNTAVQFTEGTGGICAIGSATVTGPMRASANSGVVMSLAPFAVAFTNTVAGALCIGGSAGQTVSGWISYTMQP